MRGKGKENIGNSNGQPTTFKCDSTSGVCEQNGVIYTCTFPKDTVQTCPVAGYHKGLIAKGDAIAQIKGRRKPVESNPVQ